MTVEGYFGAQSGAGGYVPLPEGRILDTTSSPIAAGATLQLQVSGQNGVPAGANAFFANLTATEVSGGSGGLTVWPAEQSLPSVSTIRWNTGSSSSGASLDLGASGTVNIKNTGNQPVILTMDLDGYFQNGSSSSGSGFFPVNERLYDSHATGSSTLAGGDTVAVQVAGAAGDLPASDSMLAAALVVSVQGSTSDGTVSVYGSNESIPVTSTLAYSVGDDVSALTFAPTGVDGSVEIYNSGANPIELTVDAQGYFSNALVASLTLSGHVYNADGAPSANTPLSLTALDYSDEIVPDGALPIAAVVTDSNGSFSISTSGCCITDLATLRALAADNAGYVNLEVIGGTSDQGLVANDFPAKLVTSPAGDSLALLPETGTSPTVSNIQLQAGRGLVQTVATTLNPGPFAGDDSDPAIGLSDPTSATVTYDGSWPLPDQDNDTSVPAFDGPDYQPDGPWAACLSHAGPFGGYVSWEPPPQGGAPPITPYVMAQGYDTGSNTTTSYDEEWSDTSEMGAAIVGEWGPFGAGLTRDETHETAMGAKDSTANWWEGGFFPEWQFHQRRAECHLLGYHGGQTTFWMNSWKWVPLKFAGGIKTINGVHWSFSCTGDNHKGELTGVHTSSWVTQNKSVLYKGMFSIAGVSLNARQTSGEHEKLTWHKDAGAQQAYICGNDDVPSGAHRVEEVEH